MSDMQIAQKMTARTPARAASARIGGGFVYGLILPVAAALVYEAAFRAGLVQARLLPPPSRIAETLWKLASTGALTTHVVATLLRVGLGFGLGAVAGVMLGALTGSSTLAMAPMTPR